MADPPLVNQAAEHAHLIAAVRALRTAPSEYKNVTKRIDALDTEVSELKREIPLLEYQSKHRFSKQQSDGGRGLKKLFGKLKSNKAESSAATSSFDSTFSEAQVAKNKLATLTQELTDLRRGKEELATAVTEYQTLLSNLHAIHAPVFGSNPGDYPEQVEHMSALHDARAAKDRASEQARLNRKVLAKVEEVSQALTAYYLELRGMEKFREMENDEMGEEGGLSVAPMPNFKRAGLKVNSLMADARALHRNALDYEGETAEREDCFDPVDLVKPNLAKEENVKEMVSNRNSITERLEKIREHVRSRVSTASSLEETADDDLEAKQNALDDVRAQLYQDIMSRYPGHNLPSCGTGGTAPPGFTATASG